MANENMTKLRSFTHYQGDYTTIADLYVDNITSEFILCLHTELFEVYVAKIQVTVNAIDIFNDIAKQ
jgi:hypothetical protein